MSRHKYQVVPFRMSPEEKAKLKALANKTGISMNEWMRLSIAKAKE